MKKVYIFSIFFLSLFCLTSFAFAQVTQVTIDNPLGTTTFNGLLTDKIIPGVVGIIAALSTIMITIAGILYLTSAGSPERINTAKKALTYAIIGLVIAIAAGSIAAIIKNVLGVT